MVRHKPPILIPCPHCEGDGQVELPQALAKVLTAVNSGGRTAEQVHARVGDCVSVNAISNRLSDLLKLRLVLRHREGKFWHYTVAKQ